MAGRRLAAVLLAVLATTVYIASADGRGRPPEEGLTFFIRVLGYEDGKARPLGDAHAGVLPGQGKGTDRNGYVVVKAAPHINAGDYVTVHAEKDEWKSASQRILVDRDVYVNASRASSAARFINYLLGRKESVITLTLQPEDEAGPIVQLVIQVRGQDLKPIHGASVSLVATTPYRLTPYASFTSEGGEVRFAVPRELIEEGGLQARVFAGDHGSKFSDVPDSVLRGKGERLFLVVVGNTQQPTWSGTWRRSEVAGTMTLSQSASGVVGGSWTWNDGTGKVSGKTKDGRLTGRFSESCCSGSFDLRLSGKSFSGSYTCSTGCGGTGSFSGTCIAGRCLQNS